MRSTANRVTRWDSIETHRNLIRLTCDRAIFRTRRLIGRLKSPRRLLATTLALAFLGLYLVNGWFILSARQPADPENLKLWLSGGMVIYGLYHAVRCVWSTQIPDLELSPAERYWLENAPIHRSTLAAYFLSHLSVTSALKTVLLAVVLWRDVRHPELLLLGVFCALVLLEMIRSIIRRCFAGLDRRRLHLARIAMTSIIIAAMIQIIARLFALTPSGSPTWVYLLNGFTALGDTASCQTIQWLSVPWVASSSLAITQSYHWITGLQLIASVALIPLSMLILVHVDRWAEETRQNRERQILAAGTVDSKPTTTTTGKSSSRLGLLWMQSVLPKSMHEEIAIIARQSVSFWRYKGTILASFVIPTLLCLSPLALPPMATGRNPQQWFFIMGGIALCTILLAPPALKLDFRRDLPRMLLLRSLPVHPRSMVLGQIALPVLVTWLFQWTTIFVAAIVTQPDWSQFLMWTGILNALTVFTFAAENALFLAFPHQLSDEGVVMMIRAKLTFLGKVVTIGMGLGFLALWGLFCKQFEVFGVLLLVTGALIGAWFVALVAITICVHCWKRFDLNLDMPPQ